MNCRNPISEELAGFVVIVRGQLARWGWGRPHLQTGQGQGAPQSTAIPLETCIWKLPGEKKPTA